MSNTFGQAHATYTVFLTCVLEMGDILLFVNAESVSVSWRLNCVLETQDSFHLLITQSGELNSLNLNTILVYTTAQISVALRHFTELYGNRSKVDCWLALKITPAPCLQTKISEISIGFTARIGDYIVIKLRHVIIRTNPQLKTNLTILSVT